MTMFSLELVTAARSGSGGKNVFLALFPVITPLLTYERAEQMQLMYYNYTRYTSILRNTIATTDSDFAALWVIAVAVTIARVGSSRQLTNALYTRGQCNARCHLHCMQTTKTKLTPLVIPVSFKYLHCAP